jgi:hypothetical protein
MSKPKVYQKVFNFKITSEFQKELEVTAKQLQKPLSDITRAALYMFNTYYKDDVFGKKEKKDEFFKSWIKAAKDYERYFIAREFMADFDTDKAEKSEKIKKLKTIQKNFKKFNVEDK